MFENNKVKAYAERKTMKSYKEYNEELEKAVPVIINGDIAIKPYFYMRNGILHVRFTVDRAVELSKTEEQKIKSEMAKNPADKQNILSQNWNLLTDFVGKEIISDGIRASIKKCKEMTEKYNNGFKD